jgi:hypothetical protein
MDAKNSAQNPPKAPYTRPALKTYGGVAQVTLSSQTQNMNDPGNSNALMT